MSARIQRFPYMAEEDRLAGKPGMQVGMDDDDDDEDYEEGFDDGYEE